MSAHSTIEWTDHTWSPWEGCQKAGPGCDHCYAEARNARFSGGQPINWGPGAPRREMSAAYWRQPIRWNADAAAAGMRQRVFPSLCDPFDNAVSAELRRKFFALIEATPWLTWLLLTKRIGNARSMLPASWLEVGGWPDNVRIGATICNQDEAERDIPKLLELGCPNFLSIEPLLGRVDLERPMPGPDMPQGGGASICQPWMIQSGIDWVIVGGESGPGARPMHPDWARSLRDQCQTAGVPFLFKQWGEWASTWHAQIDPELAAGKPYQTVMPMCRINGTNDSAPNYELSRVGKKAAGRLLDGREWNGVPK